MEFPEVLPFVFVFGVLLVAMAAAVLTNQHGASRKTSEMDARNADMLDSLKDGKLTSAFNAKAKTGEPAEELSRLLYALYGMESYPGYLLGRCAEPKNHVEELGWLVHTLRDKLSWAEDSLRDVIARRQLFTTYTPLIKQLPPINTFIAPDVLNAASGTLPIAAALEEVTDCVYRFPLLTPAFCEELIAQASHFLTWQNDLQKREVAGSKDFNTRLCVVEQMGPSMDRLLDVLKNSIMDPLSRILFPEVLDAGVTNFRYGFIIGYSDSANNGQNISRNALQAHTDDSEVTLTICLGRQYTGGEVILRHLRSDRSEGEEQTRIKMETGQATLFLGQQLHEVEEITSGERYIFVIWARAKKFRASTCPCCRMFRRTRCVCGPEMN